MIGSEQSSSTSSSTGRYIYSFIMKKRAYNSQKRSADETNDEHGNDDANHDAQQDSFGEHDETTHTGNISRINDNDNNGMGVARRASRPPSPTPSSRPPRPSTSMRLIDEDDPFGKLKSASSTDTVSTATASLATRSMASRKPPAIRPPRRSRRAQRQLFNRQLQLLASISGGSVVMFLFFFLNFFAFSAIIIGVSSTSMLFYTMYAYIMQVLSEGDGALFDFLPESAQNYLMNTSLHEAMTDDSNFLENRWYLLYFIPGLTPEQVSSMVARLPARHREMAHGPGGIARLALPDSVFRLIAPPNAIGGDGQSHVNPPPGTRTRGIGGSGQQGHVLRITDGEEPVVLPVIEEIGSSEEEDLEEEVTMQDAVRGIIGNARAIIGVGDNTPEINAANTDDSQQTDFNDLHWGDSNDTDRMENTRVEVHIVDDSDSETSDLGLDVSTDAFSGGMSDGQLSRLGRMLGLRRPPSEEQSTPPSPPNRSRQIQLPASVTASRAIDISHSLSDLPNLPSNDSGEGVEEEDEATIEEQQLVEGDLINEAISTMFNNLTTNASDTIINTTVSVVESVTPTMIRTGTRLSSIASVGLLGMFASSNMQPISVMGRTVGGSSSRRLGEGRGEGLVMRGLLSTLVMGGISVGSAYATRFFTRRYLKAKRALGNGTDDNRGEKPKIK